MEYKELYKKINKPFNTQKKIIGLTMKEVQERVLRGEVNKIPKSPSRTIWQMIRANFFNVFNVINVILATLVIIAGSPKDAVFALVIVVNSIIGVGQELSARKTLEKLSVLSMAHVNVLRNGEKQRISIEEVVRDDVVCLESGEQILADAVVLEGDELEVDESMLTGEADPIYKVTGDKLYSGSFVIAGEAYARVTFVGKETYSSKLAEEARKFKIVNSELQGAISKIMKLMLWLIGPIGVILAITQFKFANLSWEESVIGSVSGIIGMIPEGLVLLTSTTFIISVVKLAKHNTLVQQLSSTEILARVDTLCVDKTGTITEGRLDLVDVIALNDFNKDEIDNILGILANKLPSKNPTQQAIAEKYPNSISANIIEKVPFSSRRKWGGIVLEKYGTWILGAPEVVLGNKYNDYKNQVESEAEKGRRVLLLCKYSKESLKSGIDSEVYEAALILIEDVIRKEAPEVLEYFKEEGVELKVISGDNPVTVAAVARRAGVQGADKYIDARNLPTDIEELKEVVDNYNIFGRVNPHQKKDIVKALKLRGHTVAMTGDGVNDVLALKESDCGIAMANGSEATKAVAQLVLMNSEFSSLPKVVAEGRKQIYNLERVAELFLSKTGFFIIIAIIFCVTRIQYPLSPLQSSLVGSCAIGIPALFLSNLPYIGRIKDNFMNRILHRSIPNGLVMAILVTIAYFTTYFSGYRYIYSSSIALLVFLGVSLLILAKVSLPLTKAKIALILAMITCSGICYFTPIGRKIFSLDLLEIKHWILSAVLIGLYYPIIFTYKRFFRKKVSAKIS